jgi:hypothetical protein
VTGRYDLLVEMLFRDDESLLHFLQNELPSLGGIVSTETYRVLMTENAETRVLLSGLGMGESSRWHDDRLWFSDWGTNIAVDIHWNSQVMDRGAGGSGWAANWIYDGRMLVTGADLIRVEPGGRPARLRIQQRRRPTCERGDGQLSGG